MGQGLTRVSRVSEFRKEDRETHGGPSFSYYYYERKKEGKGTEGKEEQKKYFREFKNLEYIFFSKHTQKQTKNI